MQILHYWLPYYTEMTNFFSAITPKEIFIGLVITIMIGSSSWYIWQIRQRRISPTFSTWLIFSLGTLLSVTTYGIAENHDFQSGVLIGMDVISTCCITVVIAFWGQRGKFRSFEKWYLIGVVAILTYGLLSGNAWNSNLFTQALISLGYLPTLQAMLTEKRNTESFFAWSCALFTALLSLYPSFVDGNALAITYSIRTIVLVFALLLVMAYYQWFKTKVSQRT
jgi:CDP-diglyceride synthetase